MITERNWLGSLQQRMLGAFVRVCACKRRRDDRSDAPLMSLNYRGIIYSLCLRRFYSFLLFSSCLLMVAITWWQVCSCPTQRSELPLTSNTSSNVQTTVGPEYTWFPDYLLPESNIQWGEKYDPNLILQSIYIFTLVTINWQIVQKNYYVAGWYQSVDVHGLQRMMLVLVPLTH